MKLRLLIGALFKTRNIALLIIIFSIMYSMEAISPIYFSIFSKFLGVALYFILVIQSLTSKKFHEDFNKKEKIRKVQNLNYNCYKLANEAKKYTNSTYLQKLRKVMFDKDEMVKSFLKGEKSLLKEKIVEQTLNLVIAYNKLLVNFCIRSRELKGIDIIEVANRININLRKQNFTKDESIAEDIKKVIEMDERMISRQKDEKIELERIAAKLNYMESTISMFKHQIFSKIESEEMIEKLETAVNEASALESVLEERRRNKTKY